MDGEGHMKSQVLVHAQTESVSKAEWMTGGRFRTYHHTGWYPRATVALAALTCPLIGR